MADPWFHTEILENVSPYGLRVCSLEDSLGIDVCPRFSWKVSGGGRGGVQSAYRIWVSSREDWAQQGVGDVWDSGRVDSSDFLDVPYAGNPLAPKTAYYWAVQIWDGKGVPSAPSAPARFSMGITDESLWQGKWIGHSSKGERAAVLLRKEFSLEKPVLEAFAYICGLGFFELKINGKSPDDSVLNPFPSQYDQTVLYRTFDVTSLLVPGDNAVGIELGNSFYNEIAGVWKWQEAEWRDEPKAILNLDIRYADGSRKTIFTDESWKASNQGPVTANSMYYGEVYDARKEQPGYNLPGFDDAGWEAASPAQKPLGRLKAHRKAPVKRAAAYVPSEIRRLANGSYLVVSPEMAAGWIRLTNIREEAGRQVTITYGQALNPDGTVVKWGGPDGRCRDWWPEHYIQQDRYICKGTGVEEYEPKFSYKGHQYIQIDGLTHDLSPEDIVIYRVSNAVQAISEFSCSNPMLNTLHGMMQRAMVNNFQGERCDPVLEKNGWLGDANVSLGCLMMSFDMPGCLPGWLAAMEDCQKRYGIVPIMVPCYEWGIHNYSVWNTLFVYGVQALEQYFGMSNYARGQYGAMRELALTDIRELTENGWLWPDNQLGDWVSPMGMADPGAAYDESASEGSGIVGAAFVYGALGYLKQLADDLGKHEDASQYQDAMERLYEAFNRAYYRPQQQIYQTGTWHPAGSRTVYRQTSNLVPLAFGLVPKDLVQGVVDNLVRDIQEKGYHLDTGCVGTRYLLPILCDYGYADVAYRIVTQTTYPSWGFWMENGATSTWEMWETTTRSFDHYFLGTYDEWFYTHLAGITKVRDGYGSFAVAPHFVGNLTHAQASIETVRGLVSSSWTLEGEKASVRVTVPFGSTAEVFLPAQPDSVLLDGKPLAEGASGVGRISEKDGRICVQVGAGEYAFACRRKD